MVFREAAGALRHPRGVGEQREHLGGIDQGQVVRPLAAEVDEPAGDAAASRSDIEHLPAGGVELGELAADVAQDRLFLAGAVGVREADLLVQAERRIAGERLEPGEVEVVEAGGHIPAASAASATRAMSASVIPTQSGRERISRAARSVSGSAPGSRPRWAAAGCRWMGIG